MGRRSCLYNIWRSDGDEKLRGIHEQQREHEKRKKAEKKPSHQDHPGTAYARVKPAFQMELKNVQKSSKKVLTEDG